MYHNTHRRGRASLAPGQGSQWEGVLWPLAHQAPSALLLSVFLILDEDTPQDKRCGYMSVCVCVCTHHRTSSVDTWACVCVAVCVSTPQDKRCGYMSVCVCVCIHTTGQAVWIHERVCVCVCTHHRTSGVDTRACVLGGVCTLCVESDMCNGGCVSGFGGVCARICVWV